MSQISTSCTASPPQTSVLFVRAVIARLAIWSVLRIAVDQSWGGPESSKKRTWLASVIVDAFEEEDPLPDTSYVELTLLQVLEDEFDVTLEDGSALQVAEDILKLWGEAQAGKSELIQRLEEQADKTRGNKVEVEVVEGEGDEDEDDWESESGSEDEDEAPMLIDPIGKTAKPEPEVDDDGFTTVKGRGSKHR